MRAVNADLASPAFQTKMTSVQHQTAGIRAEWSFRGQEFGMIYKNAMYYY